MPPASLNRFDAIPLRWLNSLVGMSVNFDKGIDFISGNHLFEGAVFMALFWWYWFRKVDTGIAQRTREHLLCTLGAGVVGILLARILALLLPFRVRPRFEPALHFIPPNGEASDAFMAWSAFPSDHAVLFSALAAGLCFISWRTGLLAMLYSFLIIDFPRVYLGFHYPTDILAGALLGAMLGYGMNLPPLRNRMAGVALQWESTTPGAFYAALFILSFQLSTMFESLRYAALATVHFAGRMAAAT